jgi:Holliday junction DNA helicase RuvA
VIASVTGTVRQAGVDGVVIEVGGVGLRLNCTPRTTASLRVGAVATLATTLVVREDSLTLFGFVDEEERSIFETLQGVSGVGPRLAQALLAALAPESIRRAVASGDEIALTAVSGIGRKGAARLILELKDRLGPATTIGSSDIVEPDGWRGQLQSGLLSLGWTVREAAAGISAVAETAEAAILAGGTPDVGALLRQALRSMARS